MSDSSKDHARALAEDLSEAINYCAYLAGGRELAPEHLALFRTAMERLVPVLPNLTPGSSDLAMDLASMSGLAPRILSALSSTGHDPADTAKLCQDFVRCVPYQPTDSSPCQTSMSWNDIRNALTSSSHGAPTWREAAWFGPFAFAGFLWLNRNGLSPFSIATLFLVSLALTVFRAATRARWTINPSAKPTWQAGERQ